MGLAGITLSLAAMTGCMGGALSTEEQVRNELGIQCEAKLAIEGRFEASQTQPSDIFGCWPVGVWTFKATVVENGCPNDPLLEEEYVFEVTRDVEEVMHYQYVNDPSFENVRMKVTSGGSGLCEGGFEVFTPDATILTNLKPNLMPDGTLTGQGEYIVYDRPKI
jgi:hypothetical protein